MGRFSELFVGEISENDKLVYVNDVIKGKLLDCEILVRQAVNNTKEQFANSPDLDQQIMNAVMDALASFSSTHLRENPLALVMGRKAGSWF
ncbi:MAG: hypothetical protein WJ289_05530 [Ferrovum myxofaciens]|uniref:hypothetical protein n=1 Tax=Ferrovum myxofaciens TaxID=416213 RepID=UPI003EBBC02D